MSEYRAKPGTLHPVREGNAWMIHDAHGPYDGPYESEGAAWEVIRRRERYEQELLDRRWHERFTR